MLECMVRVFLVWWNFCSIEQHQPARSLSCQKIFDANEGCMIYADFMMYDASRSAETPVSHDTTKFVVSKCVRVIKLGWSSYPQIFSANYLVQRDIQQHPTTSNNLPPPPPPQQQQQ